MSEDSVQVGKYTLESLTTGMYSDPKIVYREYIQNSVDSLEEAVRKGVLEVPGMRIDIIINEEESSISIRDNGMGVKSAEAKKTLLNVGSSKKRNANSRGFRGIGRLGGMSYCDTLTFSTSAEKESVKTIVSFDCKKLRQLLIPGQFEELSLSDVLSEITTVATSPEKPDKHYFLVEMSNVSSLSDLLNIDAARSYISQVAPLPYHSRNFIYASQLKEKLSSKNYYIEEFPVFVGESESDLEPIYKPNRSRYRSDRNKRIVDEITSMEYFDVLVDGELYATGWYGNCGWYGTLSDRELSGFRVRKGNILIGDSRTLNSVFKEPRFNGWVQGEIFVLTDKLVPNARRDDFEQNDSYYSFLEALSQTIAPDISKAIRDASLTRNDPVAKVIKEVTKTVSEAAAVVSEGFNSSVDKENLITALNQAAEKLDKAKAKDELAAQKEQLRTTLEETIKSAQESKNYKINQINSGIDKKSKQVLKIVSDILSKKLAKFLVDEIIEEIITELNGK